MIQSLRKVTMIRSLVWVVVMSWEQLKRDDLGVARDLPSRFGSPIVSPTMELSVL